MSHTLIIATDSLQRQNQKLLKIAEALMRRAEQSPSESGLAYAQFERAALLEEEVRNRTFDLEQALDQLNLTHSQLAQANAATETARADLSNAIETIHDGFALFNASDTLVMCNSRFGKWMRDVHPQLRPGLRFKTYVQLVSRSHFLALPSGVSPAQWAKRRMSHHREKHAVFNSRIAGQRWLQISEQRTSDGGTVILQTDVTDMMRLERRERDRLLDDQARLIRATLDHLDQGVCIFDTHNLLAGSNQRASELLTLPMHHLTIGSRAERLYQFLRDHGQFPDANSATRLRAWMISKDTRAPLSFEVLIGARALTAFAQQMPDGGFVISFTDITTERAAAQALVVANETLERRVAERTLELEAALSDAERANASKSRFVAAASHDLMQPLSAAKLYMASLAEGLHTPELLSHLDKATNALAGVEDILGALLDISKLDSGQVAVELTDVALGDMLGQLSDELAPLAAKKGLDFRIVLPGATVRSDATFLRRILQNLISNAVRYTSSGKILVGARRCGNVVRIEVHDTGPGIPADQHQRIFDEFHRLNTPSRPTEGVGLGLTIVKRACDLLDHPLQLHSQPGHTMFAVTLPLSNPQVAVDPTPTKGHGQADLPSAIVLLIENDSGLRSALTVALEAWGLDVFACASAREAMSLLQKVDIAPDLVIADYQLDDGLLGSDAIAQLRQRHGPLPACLITANRNPELARLCKSIGADLLHKPINPSDLRLLLLSRLPTDQA
ncbi:hybrid sensor histidine kinase/response regulator [Parasedimentitalea psychrophila]|uniref:histidine kinase n=1 Tax=Parasedimentitalea psychrophila TaxID=2997337 RepID=A0A9Y2L3P3_9RHOB|nr:PAS-domain containing protein [Parasedimentitalea psychrophila]WIY26329.1 PAS-domain containing protein [Parasedimentitalea psychrophila]